MNAPVLRVEPIALEKIHESPTNPRRTFNIGALEELAEDIKRRGVLQPVLVRPMPAGKLIKKAKSKLGIANDEYELVFGARRYRAVQMAGFDSILCIVRDMNDAEVIETQVIENAKRVDIHPLEEADAYALLIEHKLSVDEIANRIGREVSHIRRRLRLTALHKEVRKLFLDGHLFVGHAEMVAGLALSMQVGAAKVLAGQDEPLSLRQAADVIRRDFLLRLASAPFDTEDTLLVATAGACTVCPKRTGAQQELFAAAAPEESCTDRECWQSKIEANWKQRAANAQGTGRKVVKEADKVFEKNLYGEARTKWDGAYADVDREVFIDGKKTTYRKALGKELDSKKLVLARDHAGQAHDVISKKDLAEVAKKAKVSIDYSDKPREPRKEPTSPTKPGKERERPIKEVAEERAERELLAAVAAAASKRKLDDGFMRWIATQLITSSIGVDAVCDRRDVEKLDPKKFAGGDLRGLVAELLAGDELSNRWGEDDSKLDRLLGEWGLSWTKAVAAATTTVQAERDAKKPAPKSAAKPAKKAAPKKKK